MLPTEELAFESQGPGISSVASTTTLHPPVHSPVSGEKVQSSGNDRQSSGTPPPPTQGQPSPGGEQEESFCPGFKDVMDSGIRGCISKCRDVRGSVSCCK